MNRIARGVITATAIATVALGAAACSSNKSSSTPAASSTSAAAPLADIPALSGQSTAVALDSNFVAALGTLKLTPGVIGTAKLTNGSLVFPITGGNVKYFKPGSVSPYVVGDIKHDGSGFSLTGGATKVSLTNFDIDPGASKLYGDVAVNGKSAATHALLFGLNGNTLKPLQTSGNTAILEGTQVQVSQVAADLLNSTFKTTAVKGGLLVGIAKITVNTK
ncbi:hypothetical protein M6D93_15955 [Jatrophihabitans telluris]|uniref:Lipoprotein n=1 Tax=Jatrophihabitans telluris TaxID=2038343 RepID=A0ABY4QY66_9ACTN|nr:hypothetical protein [Jatrophihabitans telluris]UQX87781.1 hypothetical protein M6D93_15955 [Jatrophihabitans telluris]